RSIAAGFSALCRPRVSATRRALSRSVRKRSAPEPALQGRFGRKGPTRAGSSWPGERLHRVPAGALGGRGADGLVSANLKLDGTGRIRLPPAGRIDRAAGARGSRGLADAG